MLEALHLQQIDVSTSKETDCCSSKTHPSGAGKKPCNKHLKAARERYATTLEAVGCICKALIARNLESCCSSIRNRTKGSSGHPTLRTKTSGGSFRAAKSTTSCSKEARSSRLECGEKTDTCGSKTDSFGKKLDCCREASNPSVVMIGTCGGESGVFMEKNGCCGGAIDTCEKGSPAPGACGHKSCCGNEGDACTKITPCDTSENCSPDACCSKLERQDKSVDPDNTPTSGPCDIEKSTAIIEHVTLNVEGLTCVGCENKLFRSLNVIPGIRHLQTSLVMSRAEFDMDADAGSVSDIIREVTKATGFACERVRTQGQSLDILVPGDGRDFINQKLPYGVEGMVALDKQTVRVTYDAGLIGARDLLERAFDSAVKLGPPRPYAELESGGKHVRKTAYMTVFSAVLTIPVLPSAAITWAVGSSFTPLALLLIVIAAGPFD